MSFKAFNAARSVKANTIPNIPNSSHKRLQTLKKSPFRLDRYPDKIKVLLYAKETELYTRSALTIKYKRYCAFDITKQDVCCKLNDFN